jgi:hypothetical protein
MSAKLYIYVSGPLTTGQKFYQNIGNAIDIATKLLKMGYTVYLPHLSFFWAAHSVELRDDYEMWIGMDLAWIDKCDAVYRLDGVSSGGNREVNYAISECIPVITSLDEAYDFITARFDEEPDNE